MVTCQACGKETPEGNACESCGAPLAAAASPAAAPAGAQPQKSPGLAAIGSFLCSGLGQVYNGQLAKGLLLFFGSLIGWFIFMIPGIIVWIYGIYDAYTTAKKMNEGSIPFVPHNMTQILVFVVVIAIVFVLMVTVIMAIIADMYVNSPYYGLHF